MTYTVSFETKEEAINWFSMMDMRMVRALPASYVGVMRGDEGEVIDMVAIKCGLNEYEMTERAR
jgi:hypothetical protein